MGVVYILLMELSHAAVFACWDARSDSMVPLHIIAVIVAVVFVLAVALHGRQVRRDLIYFFVFLNKLVVWWLETCIKWIYLELCLIQVSECVPQYPVITIMQIISFYIRVPSD